MVIFMNVLILSAGTRNGLIRCFRDSLAASGGRVIAADASSYAPALYEADGWYLVPLAADAAYLPRVLEICQKEQIVGLFSLTDPETVFLAEHADAFRSVGVRVLASPPGPSRLAFDKWEMYRWLCAHGYRCAETWLPREVTRRCAGKGAIQFPAVVKPRRGSASTDVVFAATWDSLNACCSRTGDCIIQEYLNGQEIGVDAYVDFLTGKMVSIFAKRKLRMRAGETDKAVSFQDDGLFLLMEHFLTEAGFLGPVDIDLFSVDGSYYISEVNPRFGGGYPLAHACGCDFPGLLLNNLAGVPNQNNIGSYEEGVYMMKYSDVLIRRETELIRRGNP